MSSSFKFYRYEGYSYRVEVDAEGKPVSAYVLQDDGTWSPVNWGWQVLMNNNLSITEAEAFTLAGIKNMSTPDSKTSSELPQISGGGIST